MTEKDNTTPKIRHGIFNWRDWVWLALVGLFGVMFAFNARAGSGALLLQGSGQPIPAASVNTSVEMTVRGPVARVSVTQHFTNHTDQWMEGVYQFPLPDDAAVDGLRMRVGERIIEGEIQERREAKRTYTQAREEGKRAALVNQERPNLFTTHLANIPPGETIEVTLDYVQTARWRDGAFELRFPMTYTPRYEPGSAAIDAGKRRSTAAESAHNPAPAIAMDIRLDAGMPLAALGSPHHDLDQGFEDGWHRMSLNEGVVDADRDFVLRWEPATGQSPRVAAFSESVDNEEYAILMVVPPAPSRLADTPREVIFVMDTSGSMHGASIQQARSSLVRALERLGSHDRFNVIAFDDDTRALFPEPVPVDEASRRNAIRWVGRQAAGGGTLMAPALEAALDGRPPRPYLRQVVFMTDGAVGNEQQLLEQIHERLGEARLFTVGIGSAPNSWFMRKAAGFGRGSFTHIGDTGEVDRRMDALLDRLAHPAMTDLCVSWPTVADQYPDPIPDLYAGEPLVVFARLPGLADPATVCGTRDGTVWRQDARLNRSDRRAGIAKLWARSRIEALMDSRVEGADPEAVREQVLAVALEHRLMSPFTSFVAVDRTPARVAEKLEKRRLASAAPAGNSTGLPQTAAGLPMHALVGLLGLLLAAAAWRLGREPVEARA